MLNLVRGLLDEGWSVNLVVAKAEGPYLRDIPKGCKLVDLQSTHVSYALPRLARYLRSEPPSILLSTMTHANIIALLARIIACKDFRLIVREANTISKSSKNDSKWRSRLLPFMMKLLYPKADTIIAPSQGVLKDLAKTLRLPENRINLIHNPTVTPALLMQKDLPLDHSWFQFDEPPVVLGVGRLNPQKDFSTLINAFAKAIKYKQLRLMVLGEGPERRKLENLVQKLGIADKVSFPGFINNPFNYMKNSGLFVLSSAWEGLPNVLIEAMACGVPVVSTNCASGPDEILESGKYGELVPVGNSDLLSQAIVKGVEKKNNIDYCLKLVQRSMDFSTNSIVTKYLETLTQKERGKY
jgi:glycosyltransferase involved in cell wall biosynthesis